jgi:Domain of unknown function (DUF4279)
MGSVVLNKKDKLVSSNASLQIYGRELDFELIALKLGARPTSTRKTGDCTRSGATLQNDVWSLESPLERGLQLDRHLQWLAETLQPGIGFLRSLARTPGVQQVNVFCGVTIDGEFCSLKLSPKSLSLFRESEMGVQLSLVFLELPDSETNPVDSSQNHIEVESWSRDDQHKTESQVIIALTHGRHELEAELVSLGLQSVPKVPSELSTSVGQMPFLQVPMAGLKDLDAQLRWLSQTLQLHKSLVFQLTEMVDISCSFATECEWGGFWLSNEALRLPVDLGISLGFDLRLL